MKQFPQPTPVVLLQKPTTEQIAIAAFHLYVENGCQDGHDLDDWLRAENLLTQKLKTVAKVQVSEPNSETSSQPVGIRRAATSARDERGSANREEIRQKNTHNRPASRQPQWRTTRST